MDYGSKNTLFEVICMWATSTQLNKMNKDKPIKVNCK